MIRLFLLLATGVCMSQALSCSCGLTPCQTPTCCDSGYYTLDECGCCLTCAKAKDEVCGGPFEIAGACATGLRCLRQCECKTVEGSDCIFPFSYKGETYNSCTRVESSNGAAWCATEVDSSGEVVNDKWEDCDSLCPGSDFPCAEGFLNNDEGKCVDEFEASSFLDGPLPAILDDISEFSQEPAPLCNPWIFFLGGRGAPSDKICRCTKEPAVIGLDGTPQGGCTPPRVEVDDENKKYGWCYLENIVDPANPRNRCYEDAQWSEADGRFWSNVACLEEKKESEDE